ncbi:MAG: hydrogenase formation protein HypD [Lachnospiraceae bacterium]|uniref:Hydrogenase formation protein HypD n=1 Tax=Candidatus Weimeria bifida TaxID=2599074 RepID=A0A6N7J0W5_9FIRM|nr:hydrogenase formation protein HypD [Candidatus Weimeria bifida]RRF97419.1 MAG: hydrogenase formation protein HypD [Lachnospiraceae bacterium]
MSATEEAKQLLSDYDGPAIHIMEVCGTHTHEIFKDGIRQLLSPKINLISGPGCPVCVTPADFIDEAVMLALEKNCTITTFGDLVRVPGSEKSLADARAGGAKVKVVYAPSDAVDYAKKHPDEDVVFLSVGFETTVPSECLTVQQAVEQGIKNFSLLTANKTMPGAYLAMREATDAFLYPGHVHAIIGTSLCEKLRDEYGISGVCAGFTPSELLIALALEVRGLSKGKPFFINAYPRVVTHEGSPKAVELIHKYLKPVDAVWRGIGEIKGSGLALRDEYADFDARKKYSLPHITGRDNPACRCGEVLQGRCTSKDCPLFGKACTPEHPAGACMVSSEGACSAYYLYGRGF